MPDPSFKKLNESNYTDWCYLMEAFLIEKDLWDVVDGSETQPTSSDNSKVICAFVKEQQLAQSKIILNVQKSQLPHTHHLDPKESWDSLEQVHRAMALPPVLPCAAGSFTCKNILMNQ